MGNVLDLKIVEFIKEYFYCECGLLQVGKTPWPWSRHVDMVLFWSDVLTVKEPRRVLPYRAICRDHETLVIHTIYQHLEEIFAVIRQQMDKE